jgi:hypothetical protein
VFGTWNVETRDSFETVPGWTHLKDRSGGKKLMRQISLNVEHSVWCEQTFKTYTIYVHIQFSGAAEATKLDAAAPSAICDHFFCVLFDTERHIIMSIRVPVYSAYI